MCLNSSVFPLVRLKNGKRKVLFNCDYKITNINEYNEIKEQLKQLQYSTLGISKSIYLNKIMKQNDVKSIENLIAVPCGHCEDCLKANARSWAIRILQEAKQYKNNYFITLTYNDVSLPKNGSLDKDAISKFNKKLKTALFRAGLKSDFRFYGVGEYGGDTWRPHMHIIFFNLVIPDLKFHHISKNGFPCYSSKFLERVWSHEVKIENKPVLISNGFVDIQDVDIGSACYVARYCDKKKKNLTREDLDLMKKFNLEPEYARMSRRPGIGANYLNNVLLNVLNGCYKINYKDNNFTIPKYYSNKFEELLPPDVFKDFKTYNDLVSSNFTYKNIQRSCIVDLEDEKYYNNDVVSKSRKKRGL